MGFRAEEDCGIGQGRRREGTFLEIVFGEHFESLPRFENEPDTFFILKIEPTISEDGRCGEIATETFIPVELAGAGVETRGNAAVGHEIELIAHDEG